MNTRRTFGFMLLATSIASVGCGGGDIDKTVVSGKVSYQNQPVKNGEILFYPVESTPGPVSGATIADGEFVADAKDGVPVGKHRVEIRAYDLQTKRPTRNVVPSGARREYQPRKQYLPDKYNRKSTVFLTVPDARTLTHDFHLK